MRPRGVVAQAQQKPGFKLKALCIIFTVKVCLKPGGAFKPRVKLAPPHRGVGVQVDI